MLTVDQLKEFIQTFTKKPVRFAELYPAEHEALVNMTPFLPLNVPIKQRFWHVANDVDVIPKCDTCDVSDVKWNKTIGGYSRFCSSKCSSADAHVISKKNNTMISRYGVASVMQLEQYQIRVSSANKNRSVSNQTKQKQSAAAIKRSQQMSAADRSRTGQRLKQSFVAKYGATSPMQLDQFKQRQRHTMADKHGAFTYHASQLTVDQRTKLYDRDWLIKRHHDDKRTQQQIAIELDVNPTTVGRVFNLLSIQKRRYYGSGGERELSDWLTQLGVGHQRNYRMDGRYELDIYIESHQLAIEYCGVYWHCDLHPRITADYHAKKLQWCNGNNIRLITIYDIEWINSQEICKSTILNALNLNTTLPSVGARRCEVVTVDKATKRQFFDAHHIQGNDKSNVCIGLVYDDVLIACLSAFVRGSVCEITRFATKRDIRVPGGFTKLMRRLVTIADPSTVVTYADLRWSEGKLYENAGFDVVSRVAPSFNIIDNKTKRMYHRSSFMKSKIIHRLPGIDSSLTEREMHERLGLLRVWDCGKLKYEKRIR